MYVLLIAASCSASVHVASVHGSNLTDASKFERYKSHQGGKLTQKIASGKLAAVQAIDKHVEETLKAEFEGFVRNQQAPDVAGKAVLCLGARLGGEVRAFRGLNALAIGVDLNPGPSNPEVLTGDFHHLQFASGVFDMVYTNVIGHAFDLQMLGREICRVLKPRGHFLLDARGDKSASEAAMQQSLRRPESQSIFYTNSTMLVQELGMSRSASRAIQDDLWLCKCVWWMHPPAPR